MDFSFEICAKAMHQRETTAFAFAWLDGRTHTGKIVSEQGKTFQMSFGVLRDLKGRIGSPYAPGSLQCPVKCNIYGP